MIYRSSLFFMFKLMVKTLFLIGCAGGLGCIFRHLLQMALHSIHFFSIPWATFTANLLGSMLIGAFYAVSERFGFSTDVRLMLTTGFCGGFTTFSTFSYENMFLLRQGDYFSFALYCVLSVACCIGGVILGDYLVWTRV